MFSKTCLGHRRSRVNLQRRTGETLHGFGSTLFTKRLVAYQIQAWTTACTGFWIELLQSSSRFAFTIPAELLLVRQSFADLGAHGLQGVASIAYVEKQLLFHATLSYTKQPKLECTQRNKAYVCLDTMRNKALRATHVSTSRSAPTHKCRVDSSASSDRASERDSPKRTTSAIAPSQSPSRTRHPAHSTGRPPVAAPDAGQQRRRSSTTSSRSTGQSRRLPRNARQSPG